MTQATPGVDGCSLLWSNANRNTLFTIRYRIATDSIWSEAAAQAAPTDSIVSFRLTGLRACTGYVYQVRTTCAGVVSTFSTLLTFQTLGCNAACALPAGLATYTRDSMALLYWSGIAPQYQVQYRAVGAAAFTTVTVSTPNATILGLLPCTYYEFKVKAICSATSSSDFTSVTRFKTTGCAVTTTCGVPRISALSVNGTVITVAWASTGTATYQLRYKKTADSTWTTISATGTTLQIGNLLPCTVYQFQLRSICNGSVYSEFSVSGSLTTAGCTPVSYCIAPRRLSFTTTNTVAVLRWDSTSAASYDVQWMAPRDSVWRTVRVTTNRLELGSLTACTMYQFRVRANCSATSYAYSAIARFATTGCVSTTCALPTNVRVSAMDTLAVVSWNSNGAAYFRIQYKIATDSLWTTVTVNSTAGLTTLTNLIRCKAYQVKVQSVCTNGVVSVYTEPVRFETRGCTPTCLMPTNVTVQSSDSVNALVTWNSMAGAAYVIEYYPADAPNSIVTRTTQDSLARLTGLTRCKTYVFRVRRACGTSVTAMSDWASTRITTTGCVSTCSAPTGLAYDRTLDSLTWQSGGTYTIIRWKLAGAAVWSYDSLYRLSHYGFFQQLQQCQMYICQVQTVCPTGTSDWTAELSFRSRGANCVDDGGSGVQIRDFGIYPNPGTDVVQVMYKLEQSVMAVRLDLVDLQGKIIRQLDGGQQDTGNYIQSFEGLESLNSGLYMVVLRVDGKVAMTQKWVKE
jgi:Secretion system C-terminal sorting domain